MQTVARSGSVVVSEATRKLVEGYFELKSIGPTKVKGVNEPVQVYEVTGLGALRSRLEVAVRWFGVSGCTPRSHFPRIAGDCRITER
jgi:hypothetical protein